MELTSMQAAALAEAAAKDLTKQAKAFRAAADEDVMDAYRATGAKTFDIALETDDRRVSIATYSVATKDGGWEIADWDAFADSAADAGELDVSLTIPNDLYDAVYDALRDAGLTDRLRFTETPHEGWQEHVAEVAGEPVWSATGERIEGIEWKPGKTYTVLRPKSIDIVRKAAMALFGTSPTALLEGGRDAE